MGEPTVYHYTSGIPSELRAPTKGLPLTYGMHAREQALTRGIRRLPASLQRFRHIETKVEGGVASSWLVRIPFHEERRKQWHDLCIVLNPDGWVRTVWLNATEDTHRTLKPHRINRYKLNQEEL